MITMADVYRHRRMCTAKRKWFPTELDGRMYVIRRKFKKMRIYACPYCGGFHMSSKPKAPPKIIHQVTEAQRT